MSRVLYFALAMSVAGAGAVGCEEAPERPLESDSDSDVEREPDSEADSDSEADPEPAYDASPEVLSNNSSMFRLPFAGAGPGRHREITALADDHDQIAVRGAFLFDHGSRTTYAIEVEHLGTEDLLCFVRAEELRFLDGAGRVVEEDSSSYVDGSVGEFTSALTDTCLAPGETGIIGGFLGDDTATVTAVEFSLQVPSFGASATMAADVLPTRVDRTERGLMVHVDARSPEEVGAFSKYWLLDAEQRPIAFGYLGECASSRQLAYAVRVCAGVLYKGDSDLVRVFIEHELPARPAQAGAEPDPAIAAEIEAVAQRRARQSETFYELRD